jgi:hypothetical protein
MGSAQDTRSVFRNAFSNYSEFASNAVTDT